MQDFIEALPFLQQKVSTYYNVAGRIFTFYEAIDLFESFLLIFGVPKGRKFKLYTYDYAPI